jgi:hypothetical protein
MVVQVVILSANGESRQSRITSGEVSAATVSKLCRKTKPATVIGTYDHGELTLTVWGWSEGKAGTENKHELPPPLDEGLLFGDAVVSATATEDDGSQNLSVAQWEKFYEAAFKGFHDTGGSDDEDSDGDGDADEDVEDGDEIEDGDDLAEEDGDADEEAATEEGEDDGDGSGSESAASDEEGAEEDGGDDCFDEGDDGGGGGKRRAPRRRTTTAPEYRRMDMGLRARVKVPMPLGKRAPRWQTATELEEEAY